MTWSEYIPAFEAALRELSREPVRLRFQQLMPMLRHEGTAEADAALRAFAQGLPWPLLPDLVRVELCLRLSFGLWHLRGLAAEPHEGASLSATIESVLIDYWRDTGRVDWLYEVLVKDWASEHMPWMVDEE